MDRLLSCIRGGAKARGEEARELTSDMDLESQQPPDGCCEINETPSGGCWADLRRRARELSASAAALRRLERAANAAEPRWHRRRFMRVTAAGWMRVAAVAALAAALLALYVAYRPERHMPDALAWIAARGAAGPFVLAGVHAALTVALFPGSVLCFGAGFVFGCAWGTAAVFVGEVAGAVAAFLLGRTLLAGAIERLEKSSAKLAACNRAVRSKGRRLVFLLRLSPLLPFNVINYALAVTPVKFCDYVSATAAGALPSTWLFVYAGSLAKDFDDIAGGIFTGSPGKVAAMVVGCVATVLSVAAVTFFSKRAMKQALAEGAGSKPAGDVDLEAAAGRFFSSSSAPVARRAGPPRSRSLPSVPAAAAGPALAPARSAPASL